MEEVTKVLPAVALRGTTILPDMIVHFDISRAKSIRAVEEAMLGDQKIFLITQRDPDTEVPGLLDVYKIGTIAVIKQVVRMPKDVLRILVEAESRAELLNFEEEENEYLRAEVALFAGSGETQFSDIEQEAMLRNLKEMFALYCEQTQKVSKELAGQILGTEELEKLVDQICMNLPLDYVQRQKLLEAVELSVRYDTLCVMIANEIQIQEIRSEIQGKIKERIDKNQREYILREQLKVIREELGEDNSQTEIENDKKQLEKLKFLVGQNYILTVSRDRVLIEIHLEPVRFKDALLRFRLAAAQHRPDARGQLHDAEGLDQIVVRAAVQPGDAVVLRAFGRGQDHRYGAERRRGAHTAQQFCAVRAGQHHVQHHQVGVLLLEGVPKAVAVRKALHLEPGGAQGIDLDVPDAGVVLNTPYHVVSSLT